MTLPAAARWVVVFRARTAALDADYAAAAAHLRQRAMAEFGCLAFHALSEGDHEIALSYWPDEASIARWRADPEHRRAQAQGAAAWYAHWQVEVCRIERVYAR